MGLLIVYSILLGFNLGTLITNILINQWVTSNYFFILAIICFIISVLHQKNKLNKGEK